MTTTFAPKVAEHEKLGPLGKAGWALADIKTVTWRNLVAQTRVPEAIFFSSLQPIMFVLLFRYVFGGAIPIPGVAYVQFLMPGIFVQTVCFGAVSTTIGLSEDLHKGLIERFRALPMSRAAVLGGRTTADVVRNVVVLVILTVVGFAVGYRFDTGAAMFLAGLALMLFFAYALSWGFATIGLKAPNAETAQLMAFPILFPLTFASGAFAPLNTLPGWLQPIATWQPVGCLVSASHYLMTGGPLYQDAKWIGITLLWTVGMLVVFSTLAIRSFRKAV